MGVFTVTVFGTIVGMVFIYVRSKHDVSVSVSVNLLPTNFREPFKFFVLWLWYEIKYLRFLRLLDSIKYKCSTLNVKNIYERVHLFRGHTFMTSHKIIKFQPTLPLVGICQRQGDTPPPPPLPGTSKFESGPPPQVPLDRSKNPASHQIVKSVNNCYIQKRS